MYFADCKVLQFKVTCINCFNIRGSFSYKKIFLSVVEHIIIFYIFQGSKYYHTAYKHHHQNSTQGFVITSIQLNPVTDVTINLECMYM